MNLWVKRLRACAVAVLLFLVLGGPTPGNVSSCTADSIYADFEEFCTERERWICAREFQRRELTQPQYDECLNRANPMCRSNWPTTCDPPPSRQATRTCINQLANSSTLGAMGDPQADNLPECNILALCAAAQEGLVEAPAEEP